MGNAQIKEEYMKEITITIKTFYGLENCVVEELNELGYTDTKVLNRAVQITGTWKDVYFLNLNLRCAISVLVEIAKFTINDEQDIYKKSLRIDWTEIFDYNKTFAIKGAVNSKIFSHSKYPFLLIKDAIVDQFRDKGMERPDINIKNPQITFDLYIFERQVTLSLNTSGAPLFHRGYRQETGEAPMNEVLAAAMIRMSGWDRKSNFIDPFCGSGTLLIEAAFLASGIPSNIERQHYAFKNLKNFDSQLWDEVYEAAPKSCKPFDFTIQGSDLSSEMSLVAKRNLRALPFARMIDVQSKDFRDVERVEPNGVVVTNPPYGERMGADVEEMYGDLGNWMKHKMHNYTCWIISSNFEAFKFVGLRPTRKIKLFNGDLECSFREFKIFEGSKKDQYQEKGEQE